MSPQLKIMVFIFYHDVDLRKAALEAELEKSDEKLLEQKANEKQDEKTEVLQKYNFEEKEPRIIDSIPKLLLQEQVKNRRSEIS